MARVKCTSCGAECCSCWGCDPKTYVNGLCPNCQQKQNAKNSSKSMQRVWEHKGSAVPDRLKVGADGRKPIQQHDPATISAVFAASG